MPLWDTQIISKDIDDAGNSVTVKPVTKSAESGEWHDMGRTEGTGTSTTAVVNIASEMDDIVKQGMMKAGDIRFFFKSSNSSVVIRGNYITYQSQDFQIYDIIEHRVGNTLYVLEARARRI